MSYIVVAVGLDLSAVAAAFDDAFDVICTSNMAQRTAKHTPKVVEDTHRVAKL